MGHSGSIEGHAIPLDGALPSFERLNGGAPVFTVDAQNPSPSPFTPATSGSIYVPSFINARALFGEAALDDYYMYYSTDHEPDHSVSGVWLATGPTPLGPWTGRGRVWIDWEGGQQTETPAVFLDPTGTYVLRMLYQQEGVPGAVGIQSTCAAHSNDGLTWGRDGLAIDISPSTTGDGTPAMHSHT